MKHKALLFCLIGVLLFPHIYAFAESNVDIFDDSYMAENGFADKNGSFHIQGVTFDGDTCYVYLSDWGVYRYKPGENPALLCYLPSIPNNLSMIYDTLTEEETERLYNSVTYLSAYNGVLYGYNTYSGKFGTIDSSGIHWEDVCLDVECLFDGESFFPRPVLHNIVTDNALYALVRADPYADASFSIVCFDLTTGESRNIDMEGLCGICKGNDGELLCLRNVSDTYVISTFDTKTEEVHDLDVGLELLSSCNQIGGLAYSPETDTIGISADGKIYTSVHNEEFEPYAEISTAHLFPEDPAWILPDGRYALYSSGVHIREKSDIMDHNLTIAGAIGLNNLQFFNYMHPEVNVELANSLNAEDLARMVTTQDDSIDVYIVKADYAFTAMKEKGYVASLSSSEVIREEAAEMDENILSVITDASGNIVAWPEELWLYSYGINEGYWKMFWPDRPLPETFDDVLDAWIDWELEFAGDYQGVGFVDWDFDYKTLVEEMITAYVMQHDSDGLPDIHAPALLSVLKKAKQVYDIRLSAGRSTSWDEVDEQLLINNETGPGCVYKRSINPAMMDTEHPAVITSEYYLYGVKKGKITTLPLVFDDATVPQTSARMYCYVVNPYSKHMDDAIHFVECMTSIAADMDLYYAIHPACNDPLPNPNYEANYASMLQKKEDVESAIRRAIDANEDYAPSLETDLQYYTDWLNDEGQRYLVEPSTIDAYRSTIQSAPINVHAQSPYVGDEGTDAYRIIDEACSRYVSGNLTLEAFLDEIASKMKMIYLENQ